MLQMSQFQSKQQATPAAAAAIRRLPLHPAAGRANDRLSAKMQKLVTVHDPELPANSSSSSSSGSYNFGHRQKNL